MRLSTLRLALSEFMLFLNIVTALTPPFMYFVTVFVPVARQMPLDLAHCSWVRTFPCDSFRSRIVLASAAYCFSSEKYRTDSNYKGQVIDNEKIFSKEYEYNLKKEENKVNPCEKGK